MNELLVHNDFRPAVVIPVGPGNFRKKNLNLVMDSLGQSVFAPHEIIIVGDGWTYEDNKGLEWQNDTVTKVIYSTQKHKPGREQPRNIGVEYVSDECNYIWFLDSDCLVLPETLHEYAKASMKGPRIMIGPYDWMKKGSTQVTDPVVQRDPRQALFEMWQPKDVFFKDHSLALACFSGNLVWPIEDFKRVGGFWNEIHTGRCEDGELGIRAAIMNVGMSVVKDARAFHMGPQGGHGDPDILKKNDRDVPMINERHPYVKDWGLTVVDEDGKRFNQVCPNCHESINTVSIWEHREKCYNVKLERFTK